MLAEILPVLKFTPEGVNIYCSNFYSLKYAVVNGSLNSIIEYTLKLLAKMKFAKQTGMYGLACFTHASPKIIARANSQYDFIDNIDSIYLQAYSQVLGLCLLNVRSQANFKRRFHVLLAERQTCRSGTWRCCFVSRKASSTAGGHQADVKHDV